MRRTALVTLAAVIMVIAATQAFAFNGERQGFTLNLGAGFGSAEMEIAADGASVSNSESGFATDFKIGGGINPQTNIHYFNRAIFYSVEDLDAINGMSGVGVTYFMKPEAPSFFLTGGVGIGVLMLSYDGESESETGAGFSVGIGFEFTKNWAIEASYMKAQVAEEMGVDLNVANMAVTVNWYAY